MVLPVKFIEQFQLLLRLIQLGIPPRPHPGRSCSRAPPHLDTSDHSVLNGLAVFLWGGVILQQLLGSNDQWFLRGVGWWLWSVLLYLLLLTVLDGLRKVGRIDVVFGLVPGLEVNCLLGNWHFIFLLYCRQVPRRSKNTFIVGLICFLILSWFKYMVVKDLYILCNINFHQCSKK